MSFISDLYILMPDDTARGQGIRDTNMSVLQLLLINTPLYCMFSGWLSTIQILT